MSEETKTYLVKFNFTTAHPKSRFRGRSGQLSIDTEFSLEMVKLQQDALKQMCVNFILEQKPTFKIVMLDITDII